MEESKKELINIKNNVQKYFLWCHIKYNDLEKIYSEIITQKDKEFVNDLNYEGIEFTVLNNEFSKMEMKSSICINVLVMKINGLFRFPFQIKNLKIRWTCS